MKPLEVLKEDIYNRINEISCFVVDDSEALNEDDACNYDELNAYLARHKKKSYMKAACMRMIKKYLDTMYNGWNFHERDYSVYVNDFKKFG